MSIADASPFSVARQKTMISANLNSTFLFLFLFGIYTGVYPAAMYAYLHKENRTRAKDRIIIGCTTALYFVTALDTSINFVYTNTVFGKDLVMRVQMFNETIDEDLATPFAELLISDLSVWAVFLIADGLLVWRCFHSCGRSIRRSLLPILLLTVETVMVIGVMVYDPFTKSKAHSGAKHHDQFFGKLIAGTFVSVAATSFVSTALICWQIWRHARLDSRCGKHYRTIISALIESSALYTVCILFQAIQNFINTGQNGDNITFEAIAISNFAGVLMQIMSGLAPTLMVARLAMSSAQQDNEDSSACLPSELVNYALQESSSSLTADVENGSLEAVEQAREEIEVVPRSECEVEVDRLKVRF